MIGIIVALPEELATLTTKKMVRGQCAFVANNVMVICSGVGRDNAIKAANVLIAKGAKGLISWGCAGALARDLKAGDLLFPEKIIPAKGDSLRVSEHWLAHIKKNLPVIHRSVSLVESLAIIETSEKKKKLHQQTQAVAVDMESAAIVETAEKAGLKSLVIRTISDPVTLNFPPAVSYALNSDGEIMLAKLLRYLLTHPQQIPALMKLGLNFKAAKNKLKAVAVHLDTIVGFDLNTTT
ncbi:MAG: phosphorylase [Methylococcales bacterium]|nr:phosphorylase [Methylococcales bacterium]